MTSPVVAGRNQPPQTPDPGTAVDPGDFPDLEELPIDVASATAPGSTPSLPTSTGASFANTTETITHAGSGLVFVNTYGANVSATFRNEIVAAENYYQTHFTNAATINMNFDLQALSPQVSGENSFTYVGVSYSAYVNALASHATSQDDIAAVNALRGLADPSGGQLFQIPLGEANILGLYPQYAGNYDSVTLNSQYWTASALQNSPNDAIGVIEHEISEGAMGRIGGLWAPMDLFRFTASGARDFTGGKDGQATYFSPNGANVDTSLQFHNPINAAGQDDGEDWADWNQVGADANAHDPFGPGGPGAGDPGQLSNTDLRIMDVLGWTKTPPVAVANDFNGDGMSDVLWKNNATGGVTLYEMNGTQVLGQATIGPGAGWSVVGVGDFNADGMSDVLWQNSGTGAVMLSEMNGTQVITQAVIGGGGGWSVVATGDFNGDGMKDVLWQNSGTGATLTYEMNGTQLLSVGAAGGGAGWSVAGTGDFNGDKKTDVLWQNNATGGVVMDQISGTQVTSQTMIGGGGGWTVVGTGDFDGDGKTDILWQNGGGGTVLMWEMNGSQVASQAVIGGGGGWSVVGVGDFNGDGKSDIVWQNANTGGTVMYEMNGTQLIAPVNIGGGAGWSFAGVGDYNGDGKSDVLWKNTATGALQMDEMNGTQILAQTTVAVAGTGSTVHNTAIGTLATS